MAVVCPGAMVKSTSRKMSSVPVESLTDLKTWSTEMMADAEACDMAIENRQRRHFIAFGPLFWWGVGSSAHAQGAGSKTLLVVGDSLSAEYGLARGSGWVALLDARLAREKRPYTVVNASISGDTTSGGRSRLPALLAKHQPSVLVIELGGNDALRGLPLSMTEDNLNAMAQAANAMGAKVLLLGMQVPPNYGADYGRRFADSYRTVAVRQKARLLPFFLQGIADDPDPLRWFQPDRIHPLASAHPRLLENVWPTLRAML
jgi:acyl-CoA thioesterase-1